MNCAECQQICLETGGRNLPAACAEHVTGCDGCRKVFERTLVVSRLLALKKYEHPDPLFEIRNAAAIRRKISEEPSFAETMRDFFGAQSWRVAIAGAMAVCLAAVAIHNTTPNHQAGAGTLAKQDATTPVAPVIQPQSKPDPNDPAWQKPMFVIQDVSGASVELRSQLLPGSGTQFGDSNRESRAVDFLAPGPLPQR